MNSTKSKSEFRLGFITSCQRSPSRFAARPSTCTLAVNFDLPRPVWSIQSSLPRNNVSHELLSTKVQDVLRLCAIPSPASAVEGVIQQNDLSAQLHFLRQLGNVDTTSARPLRAIRDQTTETETEAEVTVKAVEGAFAQEDCIGSHFRRMKRAPEWHSANHSAWSTKSFRQKCMFPVATSL